MPYKTLLLSVQDTAGGVVREMVEKYGLPKSEAPHFCLVQVIMMTRVMTANSLMMMMLIMMMNKVSASYHRRATSRCLRTELLG